MHHVGSADYCLGEKRTVNKKLWLSVKGSVVQIEPCIITVEQICWSSGNEHMRWSRTEDPTQPHHSPSSQITHSQGPLITCDLRGRCSLHPPLILTVVTEIPCNKSLGTTAEQCTWWNEIASLTGAITCGWSWVMCFGVFLKPYCGFFISSTHSLFDTKILSK